MNKEHFLIELKIYLKPLSSQHQTAVLEKYDSLFEERTAAGEAEEQIAKSLGKPRAIAEEILQEFGIEVPEKKLTRDGWQEIPSSEEYDEYNEFEKFVSEHPYRDELFDTPPPEKTGMRLFKSCALLAFDFLFMIWMFVAFASVVFACWVAAVVMVLSPILGAYSLIVGFNDAGLFQLFFTIFIFGIGIIGSVILLPLTKLFFRSLKNYIKWHGKVFRGRA